MKKTTATATRRPTSFRVRLLTTQPPENSRPGVQRPSHQHHPAHLLHLSHGYAQGVIGITRHPGPSPSGVARTVLSVYPLRVQRPPIDIRGPREHEGVSLSLKDV